MKKFALILIPFIFLTCNRDWSNPLDSDDGSGTTEPVFWNMADDFSGVSNPNGVWSYGRKWIPNGSSFDLFTHQTWWFGNSGHGAPNVRAGIAMWAKDNSNGLPVVRWTCPEDGNYKLESTFTGTWEGGVSVITYITINDSIYFSDNITGHLESVNYANDKINLSQNDYIDFLIKFNGGITPESSWVTVKAVLQR